MCQNSISVFIYWRKRNLCYRATCYHLTENSVAITFVASR